MNRTIKVIGIILISILLIFSIQGNTFAAVTEKEIQDATKSAKALKSFFDKYPNLLVRRRGC